MSILEGLNIEQFTKNFLETYLENGFASMPKREIDLLILHLLMQHRTKWSGKNIPTAFEISQILRSKRSKIRSMLDEISFRNQSDEKAKTLISKIILDRISSKSDDLYSGKDDTYVRIQIEDGYLRDFAKNLVQTDLGIVDTSFDRTILILSPKKFLTLVGFLLDDETRKEIEKELKKHSSKLGKKGKKTYWEIFLESIAESTGKEVGKSAVRVAEFALTEGITMIPTGIKKVLEILKIIRSDGSD